MADTTNSDYVPSVKEIVLVTKMMNVFSQISMSSREEIRYIGDTEQQLDTLLHDAFRRFVWYGDTDTLHSILKNIRPFHVANGMRLAFYTYSQNNPSAFSKRQWTTSTTKQ